MIKYSSGLGFSNVLPPLNDNYIVLLVTKKEEEMEEHMIYGEKKMNETVGIRSIKPIEHVFKRVNIFDASTSSADKVKTIDCDSGDTFNSVVKSATIRIALYIALSKACRFITWMPLTTSYEHRAEMVYMHQPMGFCDKNNPNHVCKIK